MLLIGRRSRDRDDETGAEQAGERIGHGKIGAHAKRVLQRDAERRSAGKSLVEFKLRFVECSKDNVVVADG